MVMPAGVRPAERVAPAERPQSAAQRAVEAVVEDVRQVGYPGEGK